MYLVDANVLIEAKNRYYAFDIAPGFWAWLEGAHAAGEVGSIETVHKELVSGNDELADWARANSSFFQPHRSGHYVTFPGADRVGGVSPVHAGRTCGFHRQPGRLSTGSPRAWAQPCPGHSRTPGTELAKACEDSRCLRGNRRHIHEPVRDDAAHWSEASTKHLTQLLARRDQRPQLHVRVLPNHVLQSPLCGEHREHDAVGPGEDLHRRQFRQ